MIIFKTILQILKRNKKNLIISIGITLLLVFFISSQLKTNYLDQSTLKIAVVTQEDNALTDSFKDYIKKNQSLVNLPNISNKTITDALQFGEVDYVVWLPHTMMNELKELQKNQLKTQTKEGSYKASWGDRVVDHYFNTYQLLQKNNPEKEANDLITMTTQVVNKTGNVVLDPTYQKKQDNMLRSITFNVIAYGLFLIIFASFTTINLTFSHDNLKIRNNLAPLSKRVFNRKVQLSILAYIGTLTFLFIVFLLIFTKAEVNLMTFLLIINALSFTTTMISLASLVTTNLKNAEAINGASNLIIIGSCFIGGVFVPSQILPNFINKLASFTPTYWFTQNNLLLGQTLKYTKQTLHQFVFHCFILLAFTCAFIVIQYLLKMEDKQKKIK